MNMQEDDLARELHDPGAEELLGSAGMARLAYNGLDGLPRVVPVGILWKADRIVTCTATTAPKVKALETRPNVALTLESGDTPDTAKALQVRGIAHLETVDGVADEYLEMAAKGMEGSELEEFERKVRETYDQMVRISIEPQWARFYDFGAGRMPDFLRKLVSGG